MLFEVSSSTIVHVSSAQKPVVSVSYLHDDDPTSYMSPELHLASCGLLASSVTTQAHHSTVNGVSSPRLPSSPLTRSLSEGFLTSKRGLVPDSCLPLSPLPSNRSLTPEIFVSECLEGRRRREGFNSLTVGAVTGQQQQQQQQQLTPLVAQRVRKLSHSSDEVDSRDASSGIVPAPSDSILRTSSATDLQLHLATSHSEGLMQRPPAYSNPVSPLAAFQKDGVFGAPLSALAKGMQSLAPGANKLARGMQNIGANLDPRRMKAQRQKETEEDPVWNAKKAECKTLIIEF